jgi:preprotein translocase subunit SecA
MAGRGTDIELDAAAHAAGGLHVLSCQDNPSRRQDRQLAGRAGRHGDPGSAEAWLSPPISVPRPGRHDDRVASWNHTPANELFHWTARATRRWHQWREERRRAELRSALLQQDLLWERQLSFAGPSV